MATGILEHERLSKRTITAPVSNDSIFELPSNDASVSLSYPNKLPEEELLKSHLFDFKYLDKSANQLGITQSIELNSFILSDNLIGLYGLLNSKIKPTLIYMDPPYRTGMEFQGRNLEHAYSDNMNTATYIEFLRRRLILCRETLSDDGSIYVHIGHQMVSHLKVIMDEIFGESNFRNLISRRKCSSKNFTQKQYSNLNDYVLFYSKTKNYKWLQQGVTPEKEWIEKEYNKIDELGRRYKLVPIHAPGKRNGKTGEEWKGKLPPKGKHWQYAPEKLDELDAAGDIHWSKNGNPRRKVYLSSTKKLAMTDYWKDFRDAHHQSIKITGYPTEKNFEMLKMIVKASSEEGDLVLDPFCGSGTTLHAACELGRAYIGFDASFSAAKATLKRMRYGTEKMGDYVTKSKKEIPLLFRENGSKCNFAIEASLASLYKKEISDLASI